MSPRFLLVLAERGLDTATWRSESEVEEERMERVEVGIA
jgi:hypothetical protein